MHINPNVNAVANNTLPERDRNSNVSSDVVPESGVDILDNLENFNNESMDFEELIDYDYDESSIEDIISNNVSTQGGNINSPKGSGRVK